jgi:hypothetical protein
MKKASGSFLKKRTKKRLVPAGVGNAGAKTRHKQKFFASFFQKGSAFLPLLILASCGGPPPPPVVFKPLDYSYLPPITLRAANVNVQNTYVPGPDEATLIGQDPEAPANALLDMLNRRLIPSGAPGQANVTIETASLDETGANLTGTMTVRVNVSAPNGASGFTEASVTHTQAAPDPNASPDDVRAALYGITKQLMDEMNVQLQYQLQHNMGPWVVYNRGAAAASVVATPGGGGIVATPLTGPGGTTAPVAPAPNPPQSAAPAANGLPPGSLPLGTLPVGTVTVPPAGNGVPQ